MQNHESERGEEIARDEVDLDLSQPTIIARDGDRRKDFGSLFGGYSGPERRSGRDRRADAARQ